MEKIKFLNAESLKVGPLDVYSPTEDGELLADLLALLHAGEEVSLCIGSVRSDISLIGDIYEELRNRFEKGDAMRGRKPKQGGENKVWLASEGKVVTVKPPMRGVSVPESWLQSYLTKASIRGSRLSNRFQTDLELDRVLEFAVKYGFLKRKQVLDIEPGVYPALLGDTIMIQVHVGIIERGTEKDLAESLTKIPGYFVGAVKLRKNSIATKGHIKVELSYQEELNCFKITEFSDFDLKLPCTIFLGLSDDPTVLNPLEIVLPHEG